jgi:alkenylglycerophosphocholine hydrolase
VVHSRRVPLLVFALAVITYGVGTFIGLPALALVAKPVPALALAWWTLRGQGAPLVTLGLVFSALGDFLLDLGAGTLFFVAGMAAFAVTHALYVTEFLARSRRPEVVTLLPFLLWGVWMLRLLWAGLGWLTAAVCIYAALLLAMMWRATAASLATGRRDVAVGAVLFGFSDSLIAIERFHAPVPGGRWLILGLYWAGQSLIARFAARP